LPHLIDFYEDHAADRDRFEILAFHDAQAKTFAELDPKLAPIIKNAWGGRPLPFPILLDSTGETITSYGIHAFPTMLLIDPDGKLVGEATEEVLEKKLPPIPMARRIPRALDRNINIFFKEPTLQQAAAMIAEEAKVPVVLDAESLKAAGATPETKVPLAIGGMITTRSALDLAFGAFGLTAEATPEGLKIVRAPADAEKPEKRSGPQETCARRIEEKLGQKSSFRFDKMPLEKVVKFFEGQTMENFVLDPAGRKAGALDPGATVSGEAKEEPLGEAVDRLLRPLGLHLEIRDEVVVISRRR
jgi:hypothetical protein